MPDANSVVMIGGTGAVGSETVKVLQRLATVDRITLLGRRKLEGISDDKIDQHVVDLADPASYNAHLPGHQIAICTLGVGQPSKTPKEQFTKIDKEMPLAFASACRQAEVRHFQLLSSVGTDPNSKSFYLRSKGELEKQLEELNFDRLSLFHPSMILTPTNRYGFSQAVTLAVWPLLKPLLFGPLRKLRGIEVEKLGAAIALNTVTKGKGIETLEWDDFQSLAKTQPTT